MQDININKIVQDVFEAEFPGASQEEITQLIQDIGLTIMTESMANVIEEIENKDESLAQEIKDLLSEEGPASMATVKRISEICLMPKININLEKIYQETAAEVVRDVLGK